MFLIKLFPLQKENIISTIICIDYFLDITFNGLVYE